MKITKESLKAMITPVQTELPELPEWSKMDDLGGLVPSEVRTALKAYARVAIDMDRVQAKHWKSLYDALLQVHESSEARHSRGAAIAQHVSATPGEAMIGADDPMAFFAAFCERNGYPSDGDMDAALRGAFYEGIRYCSVHTSQPARTPAAPVVDLHAASDGICGPLTDTQRNELRHLYRNLHHLGPDAMEDVVRQASVCGYVNGRRDFGDARHAAAELVASHAPSVPGTIDTPEFWDKVVAYFRGAPTARASRKALVDFINSWAGIVKEIEMVPDTPTKCDHDWPDKDGQTDMEGVCLKCGMSFQYYIHVECP